MANLYLQQSFVNTKNGGIEFLNLKISKKWKKTTTK